MTEQTISPLRRRMIEDMTIRQLAPRTQAFYIRTVYNFTVFLGRAPGRACASAHLAAASMAARYRSRIDHSDSLSEATSCTWPRPAARRPASIGR